MIWEIAWKNIWRNKTRSIIILSAISVGLFGGVFASAVIRGSFTQVVEKALRTEVPDILITKKGFTDNNEIQYIITETKDILNKINHIPEISAICSNSVVTSMISTAKTGMGITVCGVDTEKEKQVFELYKTIPDSLGSYLDKSRENIIILSQTLAKKLNIRLKSKVVLTFQSLDGELIGGAFRVAGIFNSNTNTDETHVFVNNHDLNLLAQINDNSSHAVNIRLNKEAQPDIIKQQISGILGDEYTVQTWKELRPDLAMSDELMEMMSFLILFIILIALGFSIVNTMLMVVLERTKELGMLQAVGMSKRRVFTMISLETIILTSIGGIIGVLSSSLFIGHCSVEGLNIGLTTDVIPGIDAIIYPKIISSDYITVGSMVVITGFLASVFPARRALKMNPAEVVRN